MSFAAYGTLCQRRRRTCATLQTGLVNNNNAILWTAVEEGTAGNAVSVTMQNPGGSGGLSVSVSANDVTVTLARSGGVITSTAADVIAAVNAHSGASALVRAKNYSTSSGAGLVAAVSKTNLSGGSDTWLYENVAEVISVSGPGAARDALEVSRLYGSDRYKEYVPTTLNIGDMTISLNLIPTAASHDWITGLMRDATVASVRAFRFLGIDSTTWDISGIVKKVTLGVPIGDRLSATITITPTGEPTLA